MGSANRFTAEQLDFFRRELESRKLALTKTAAGLEQDGLSDLNQEHTDEISRIRTHPADLGSDEILRQVTLSLAEEELAQIRQIEEALHRLESNQFGLCQDCGAEIPIPRLEVIPYTRYCGPCAVKVESQPIPKINRTPIP